MGKRSIQDITEDYVKIIKEKRNDDNFMEDPLIVEISDLLYQCGVNISDLQVRAIQEDTFEEDVPKSDENTKNTKNKTINFDYLEKTDEKTECTICFDCNDEEKDKKFLPCCKCIVHLGCIHEYVNKYGYKACPCCRESFLEKSFLEKKDTKKDIVSGHKAT